MILTEEVKLKKQVIGMVVAIGKGRVGYSICHPIEKTNYLGRAIEIAVGRARKRNDSIERLEKLEQRFEKEIRQQNRKTVVHSRGRDKEIHDAKQRIGLVIDKLCILERLSLDIVWSKL